MVIANGVLLNNQNFMDDCKRKYIKSQISELPQRRLLIFIPLPFNLTSLSDSGVFERFQRFLFQARVHFESSFDSEKWAPDNRGLYARNDELRAGLAELSTLHNMLIDALNQFKEGKNSRGGALIRNAFVLQESIVKNHHHRQFPDILAILSTMQRSGRGEICGYMTKNLFEWARISLQDNDPRRIMFEILKDLPLDSMDHLYLAFDSYCRRLWMSRAGSNHYKAHYSYNQASFPRAETGEFFDLYKGKRLDEIFLILREVDKELDEYSHETICLWHTAIRYLHAEGRYAEMVKISKALCMRLVQLEEIFDYSQRRQLNLDASLSYYLLGQAEEAQGDLMNALGSFALSVSTRKQVVPNNKWDPAKAAALRNVESLAIRLEIRPIAVSCRQHLDESYSSM